MSISGKFYGSIPSIPTSTYGIEDIVTLAYQMIAHALKDKGIPIPLNPSMDFLGGGLEASKLTNKSLICDVHCCSARAFSRKINQGYAI